MIFLKVIDDRVHRLKIGGLRHFVSQLGLPRVLEYYSSSKLLISGSPPYSQLKKTAAVSECLFWYRTFKGL